MGVVRVRNINVLGLYRLDGFAVCDMFELNQDSFVVDLGAWVGGFSDYILNTYDCRVDAYEPAKNVFKINHPKLNFINKAVWDGTNTQLSEDSGTGNSIKRGYGREIETVDIVDITNVHIDLLKMNIEGAEMDILPRANLDNVDQLLIEFHLFCGDRFIPPITQDGVDKVVDYIMSFGYTQLNFANEPCFFYGKTK
jgi:FkbM family methyltransferase